LLSSGGRPVPLLRWSRNTRNTEEISGSARRQPDSLLTYASARRRAQTGRNRLLMLLEVCYWHRTDHFGRMRYGCFRTQSRRQSQKNHCHIAFQLSRIRFKPHAARTVRDLTKRHVDVIKSA
jgi:hypothetical protein